MIDQARRQGIQFKVAHTIRTHHHRSILLVEGIHDLLQRLRRGIEVVGIQLNRESSTSIVVNRHVPTAAYAQIMTFRNNMNQPFVVHPVEQLCGLVSRMVIHHNDIELEISLLSQRTVDGIQNGLLAVVDGNHH